MQMWFFQFRYKYFRSMNSNHGYTQSPKKVENNIKGHLKHSQYYLTWEHH